MSTFYIKQNDTSPELQITCQDYAGDAVNVAGSTIRFHMRNKQTGEVQVDEAGSIVDGANGVVKYSWSAGDTDTIGNFSAEFEVTYSDSSVETFPNNGFITVIVLDDIA
jgi:hypothetical protein